jgi:hypothetical protein
MGTARKRRTTRRFRPQSFRAPTQKPLLVGTDHGNPITLSADYFARSSKAGVGETIFPIRWSDSSLRGLSHLIPDFVVRRRDHVRIVDAKYKAHFAELDESGWLRMAEDSREAHRADFHQVLAYASLFDAPQTTVTLVYPLRQSTYDALAARGRAVASADLTFAGRMVRAELRGLPFGSAVAQ